MITTFQISKIIMFCVWEAEDSKTCFFGVVVDIFDFFFWKKYQFPCPQCKLVLKIENMINEDKWEISTNQKMRFLLWMIRFLGLDTPTKNI